MARTFRRALTAATLAAACTPAMLADTKGDAELQFQLANLLFDETRYPEALEAYGRANESGAPALVPRARKGKVRDGAAARGDSARRGPKPNDYARRPRTPKRTRCTRTRCGPPACSTSPTARIAPPWASRPDLTRAFRQGAIARDTEPARRGARRGAGGGRILAARRRDSRDDRGHLRAAEPVRRGRQLL